MKKKIILLALVSVLGFVFFESNNLVAQSYKQDPPTLKLGSPLPENLFVELAKAINPAVVNISTSVIPKGRQYRDPMMDMLEQFYGMPLQRRQAPQNGKPQRMGLGTGFIIREDGLILTNNHVIDGADIIEVQLTENSDKTYKAEVIGSDKRTDIALIKIKADVKLTVAALGSSDKTEIGEWVAAFGNPYGHGHTMTKGVISSKGREIDEINKFPLLQTDASINPGNSGGPLVNSKGLVIGVNSAIDARAQGIGFAIPIDEVKKVLPILERKGTIRKGYLGVALGDIDDDAAESLGLDEYRGAVIMQLSDNSPAKKAGLKPYDLILEVGNKKIRSSEDLSNTISDTEPGSSVKFKVLRGEKKMDLTVKVEERPDDKTLSRLASKLQRQEDTDSQDKVSGNTPYNLGITIVDLNKSLRDEYNISDEIKNPMIAEVSRGSLGSQIGLRVGDIILSLNKNDINSAKEAIKSFKKGTNTIRVARGRGMTVITFDIK